MNETNKERKRWRGREGEGHRLEDLSFLGRRRRICVLRLREMRRSAFDFFIIIYFIIIIIIFIQVCLRDMRGSA